jgi:hypothetical protein
MVVDQQLKNRHQGRPMTEAMSYQAYYINALAVSVLPFLSRPRGHWVEFVFSVGGFFYDIG